MWQVTLWLVPLLNEYLDDIDKLRRRIPPAQPPRREK